MRPGLIVSEYPYADKSTLKLIAQELVNTIRQSVTIDWTERGAVRARIRVAVKRILRRYRYPPDKQERATQTVLKQAGGSRANPDDMSPPLLSSILAIELWQEEMA
jgi:hypothetical protein